LREGEEEEEEIKKKKEEILHSLCCVRDVDIGGLLLLLLHVFGYNCLTPERVDRSRRRKDFPFRNTGTKLPKLSAVFSGTASQQDAISLHSLTCDTLKQKSASSWCLKEKIITKFRLKM